MSFLPLFSKYADHTAVLSRIKRSPDRPNSYATLQLMIVQMRPDG
jgi:hypothetical protein